MLLDMIVIFHIVIKNSRMREVRITLLTDIGIGDYGSCVYFDESDSRIEISLSCRVSNISSPIFVGIYLSLSFSKICLVR